MISQLRAAAFTCTMFAAAMASAQCPSVLDITLIPNQNNQLEVWLRPQNDFNEFFSSIVFTVKWMDADGVELGSIVTEPPFSGMGASGPVHVDGGYRYQVYSGEFLAQFALLDESFVAGEEMLFARINVLNGSSFFEIADDEFTTSVNGSYYHSMNGQECYGEIYTFSTGVLAGTRTPGITIAPNPSAGLSTVNIVLDEVADLHLGLFDPAGRRIWEKSRAGITGNHVEQLAMENLADGVYMLQVTIGEKVSTHRVVLGSGR